MHAFLRGHLQWGCTSSEDSQSLAGDPQASRWLRLAVCSTATSSRDPIVVASPEYFQEETQTRR